MTPLWFWEAKAEIAAWWDAEMARRYRPGYELHEHDFEKVGSPAVATWWECKCGVRAPPYGNHA